MGSGYLIDSNSVIDFLMFRMPESGIRYLYDLDVSISIITRIELFCKAGLEKDELIKLHQFIASTDIYQISEEVALKTIDIRLKYKLKMPDAIIAATSVHYNFALITRNIKDFEKIQGLQIVNPYNL